MEKQQAQIEREPTQKTLGLAYITKEVLKKGEELPFKRTYYTSGPRSPFDWSKKIGQVYYKLHYCPNYPSTENSKALLLIKGAEESDPQDRGLPRIKLTHFGEGLDQLFLSFDTENMDGDCYTRWRIEGRRLEIISGEQEDFFAAIPGSGGMSAVSTRFISTAKGALIYQKDLYDNLREIFIDQNRMPFAAVKRKQVGWIEGNEYMDGYPDFEFTVHEYDGKIWGKQMKYLENGFHFREDNKINTLSLDNIVLEIRKNRNSCRECLSKEIRKEGYYYNLIRLPGYENRGIIHGHDGPHWTYISLKADEHKKPNKVYEIEMEPTEKDIQITSIKELPFENVMHISPISSQKVNDTLLEWAANPETNPYYNPTKWIYRAGKG